MVEFLSSSDAFMWSIEQDPRLRSTIVSLTLLDQSPDWHELNSRFEILCQAVPRFRKKVAASVGPPRWVADPDFDLRFHLRRVSAPRPADLPALLEMARVAAMTDFDHARPLWDATLIDGREGGGSALLCRLNHALTDGVGAVEMAATLFDGTADFRTRRSAQESAAAVATPSLGIVGAVSGIIRTVAHGLLHPVGDAAALASTAASLVRIARPTLRQGSPTMTERSTVRQLATLDVPTEMLHHTGAAAGGTLNDAFIAGLTEGLRLYHLAHSVRPDKLVVMMPISIRIAGDPMSGNRATLMRFMLPGKHLTPGQLIRYVHKQTAGARKEKSLGQTHLVAGLLNAAPSWYVGQSLRHVDFVASDVPAFPKTVYLAGAAVSAQYAFSPTLGAAFNATLVSYAGTSAIGINVDRAAVPDLDVFMNCLRAGIDNTVALARD